MIGVRAYLGLNVSYDHLNGFKDAMENWMAVMGGRTWYIQNHWISPSIPRTFVVDGWWRNPTTGVWTFHQAFGWE